MREAASKAGTPSSLELRGYSPRDTNFSDTYRRNMAHMEYAWGVRCR